MAGQRRGCCERSLRIRVHRGERLARIVRRWMSALCRVLMMRAVNVPRKTAANACSPESVDSGACIAAPTSSGVKPSGLMPVVIVLTP